MSEDNNCKVDEEELVKQYYDDIIEKGEYVEARIVIESGKDFSMPYVCIKSADNKDIANLIFALNSIKKDLSKRFPLAYCISKLLKLDLRGE